MAARDRALLGAALRGAAPRPARPPAWWARLRRAPAASRAAVARAALERHPWGELRPVLAGALRDDPGRATTWIASLRGACRDRGLAGRLRGLEAQAAHRVGRVSDALALYAAAERELRAAGERAEATALAVARVDALAAAGRVAAALALADRLRPVVARLKARRLPLTLEVNRANALRLKGDVDGAAAALVRVARRAEAAGSAYLADVATVNAGVALLEAGDPEAAHVRFSAAAARFATRGEHDLARDARANAAWADLHAGRLGTAVVALHGLASEHRGAGASRREGVVRLDLAEALSRAGDVEGARREAERAAAAFGAADAAAEQADALLVAAALSPARGARGLAVARRRAVAAGREALVVRADLLSLDRARAGGAPSPAARYDALVRRARRLGQPALAADVALSAAFATLEAGRPADAARRFAAIAAASGRRPWVRVAAEAGRARAEASSPRGLASALRRLSRVTAWLDAVGAALPGAWLRGQFAAERLEPHLARVELLLARGRLEDRREAERGLDALARRRFLTGPAPRGRDPRLARIRARLEALYDRLARGDGSTRGAETDLAVEAALTRRARAWERAAAEAWRREERKGHPLPLLGAAGARSRAQTTSGAVVHLWRSGSRLLGLVRVGDEVGQGVDLGPVADVEGLALSLRIRAHRWAFLRRSDAAATDPQATERVLATLAGVLLPALGAERWPQDVSVVADPSLPDLPWELLPFDGVRLGQVFRLLRVPAGASWARPRRSGEGTVVVGVGDVTLPGVGEEVAAIARAAGTATVLHGPLATRAAVADALARAGVVHVAGHGWDAEEAPPFAGVRLHDGWFSAADLPPDGVVADLVVLAACRSGRAAGRAALAWGGMVRSLLTAGARRVVWTIDDVDDAVTARLMTLFHEGRRTRPDTAAFGEAVATVAAEVGHAGAVLSFRSSGVA